MTAAVLVIIPPTEPALSLPQEMSRELCHQQEALWELLTTELIYVRKLKIMTDVSCPQLQPRPSPQPLTHLPCIVPHFPRPRREDHGKGWEERRGGGQAAERSPPLETSPGS